MAANTNITSLSTQEFAIFNIKNSRVALSLSHLERFNLVDEIIKIPRAPEFIMGVVRIEKGIVPLMDLEVLLGDKKKSTVTNAIALIITLENGNSFAIYSRSVPVVHKVDKINKKAKKSTSIPSDWINGSFMDGDEEIPILNPTSFWVSLGDNTLEGPSVADKTEEKSKKTKKKSTKKKEEKVEEKTEEVADDSQEVEE